MFGTFAACVFLSALSHTGAIDDRALTAARLSLSNASAVAVQAAARSPLEDAAPLTIQAEVADPGRFRNAASADQSSRRSPALVGLYVSFATLEVLDIHSTLRAIGNGGAEANPAMKGVVSNSASVIAVKAATGVFTIWMAEKMRKQHPALAIAMMAGVNSAMAIVVAHNY